MQACKEIPQASIKVNIFPKSMFSLAGWHNAR
jgi:hypothetical protein